MTEKEIDQEFRLKEINETKYFIEKIKQNEFASKNYKTVLRF